MRNFIGVNQHIFFLKGQNIMGNVIIVHEIVYSITNSKEPNLLLKLLN
jgi:hypothetical protein